MGFFEKLKNGLFKSRNSFFGKIRTLFQSGVDDDTIEELRETVSNFMDTIKKDIRYRMLLAYSLIQETPHEIEFLFEKEGKE